VNPSPYPDPTACQNFIGKVAIVTGAASGIGAATATELAARGAAVVVADINEESALLRAEQIRSEGGSAIGVAVDVADESAVEAMIASAVEHFGGLDILHNNAAAIAESIDDGDIAAMNVQVWDRTMAVNVRGAVLGCKHAIPHLLSRGGGVIVNTSSGAGTLAEPVRVAYAASKAALNSLTRSVAVQYGKQGIRCVAVAPGITMDPEVQEHLSDTEWFRMMQSSHLTTQLGVPKDVAKLVAFLASDHASFISGSVHHIDGGICAGVPYASQMRGRGTGIF
jgi:NAD(P)-dependent dehydrogenase (short-subunit alcohol dehydrogenase family)